MDTDVLLAMVASLVNPSIRCDQTALLDALVECDGNVERAASQLSKRSSERQLQGRKRKRADVLDEWLDISSAKRKYPATPPSRALSKPPSRGVTSPVAPLSRQAKSPIASSSKSRLFRSSEAVSSPSVSTTENLTSLGSNDNPQLSETNPGSSSASPTKVKVVTNSEFMTLLRPPNSKDSSRNPPKFHPLTLGTPSLVAQHTPCTLHPSILPPELACRLFYTMLNESRDWQRNKWWLFDRVVESPHRTSFYVRRHSNAVTSEQDMQEAAQFWYNGRQTASPSPFLPAMEEACAIVERMVNVEMRKRKRYPLEWGGEPSQKVYNTDENVIWQANVAASNCYEGAKESVGFHSDQLTYLGPYPTIASLSLGTSRMFRLREVIPVDDRDKRSARTYNIPLPHNSLIIMHASTQESFKHAIPPQSAIDVFHSPLPHPPLTPSNEGERADQHISRVTSSNARINITFRFYRPDFRAQTTPRCKCGVPCILRPDMKNRYTDPGAIGSADESASADSRKDRVVKYWWTCYAGAQNEEKGCGFWNVMDVKSEGRGPFAGPI